MRARPLLVLSLLLLACDDKEVGKGANAPNAAQAPRISETIELVESAPLETTLDHDDVRNADAVWKEMFDGAKTSIDIAEFYASEAEGDALRTSKLAPVIASLEAAIKRGVRVRFLADAMFAPKYPATLERLRQVGATVKTIDAAKLYGGILHAKYFVVDHARAYVGSQNFDWRALDHIQEMGARVDAPELAAAITDVFDYDWALVDTGAKPAARPAHASSVRARTGELVSFVASPTGWLPNAELDELPRLVALLDGAKKSIRLQVLTYSIENRDGSAFKTLDDALRRAAGRGIDIRILVAHWALKGHARTSLEALAGVKGIDIRVITIPPFSKGDIPFARVAHAKYMVVDDDRTWIGTSNWEGDYFQKSRNVAVMTEGGPLATRLVRVFGDGWRSTYTGAFLETAARAASDAGAPRAP